MRIKFIKADSSGFVAEDKKALLPDFAIILEKVMQTSTEMWLRMHADQELWYARRSAA